MKFAALATAFVIGFITGVSLLPVPKPNQPKPNQNEKVISQSVEQVRRAD